MSTTKQCSIGDTFDVGTMAQCSGTYVCVPCGVQRYIKKGGMFPRCFRCTEKEGNPEGHKKDLGLWELQECDDEE